ncbi:hypothetical protein LIER_00984 [Lithospermum erythrorhizon]|uniref:Uncharacterized protein n=1 Tax=Lithospermum erythrorhizon TaxID=34254 RepID=A0AAV3NMZ5_LITER
MNSNGNDDHPQRNNALNLNDPAAGRNEDAPPKDQEPINIWSGRTPPEACSSHPPEMAVAQSIYQEALAPGLAGTAATQR